MFCPIVPVVGTPFYINSWLSFLTPPNKNTIVNIDSANLKITQAHWKIWIIQKSIKIQDKD